MGLTGMPAASWVTATGVTSTVIGTTEVGVSTRASGTVVVVAVLRSFAVGDAVVEGWFPLITRPVASRFEAVLRASAGTAAPRITQTVMLPATPARWTRRFSTPPPK